MAEKKMGLKELLEKGKLLLDEMQKLCRTVRLLGVYSREEPNG